MRRWSFAKGHGTENDFVLIVDREGMLSITAAEVAWICDRRAGVGGDGLLRAVLARHVEGWAGDADLWFMDYRNADGSVAEMCGNGIRVFVRHLVDEGLAYGPVLPIATRSGVREVELLADGRIRVAMGPVTVGDESVSITTSDGREFVGVAVDVGNPHAVGFTDDVLAEALTQPPRVDPAQAFPDGVNVELVQRLDEHHLAMRVHERGSGETRSCGTGTVAAAAATWHTAGGVEAPARYLVDVPGGRVEVELGEQAHLVGPAVIVAHGTMLVPDPDDLERGSAR